MSDNKDTNVGEPMVLPCIIVDVDYSTDVAAVLIQDTRDYEFNNGQYWLTTEKPQQRTAAEGEDTRRAWVGLTDEEFEAIWKRYGCYELMREIEAKLKEKNT